MRLGRKNIRQEKKLVDGNMVVSQAYAAFGCD